MFLTLPFFPGGAGGVVGETFLSKYLNKDLKGKTKYYARLSGAILQYAAWSAFQTLGYYSNLIGPHGANPFDPPEILPFKLVLATLSIFSPDIVEYVARKAREKLF